MRRKIDPIEQEINEIRLQIYEETKHMTNTEYSEYVRKNTEDIIKEYGFKVVTNVKDQ